MRDMEGLTDEEVAEITGLREGTVRVRLHRARLFVRKEIAEQERSRGRHLRPLPSSHSKANAEPRPGHCKAMFAELSNYLDEQLDDSMCNELEKHLDSCEPCKVFLSSLQATIETCRHLPPEALDHKRAGKLRSKLIADYERLVAKNIR